MPISILGPDFRPAMGSVRRKPGIGAVAEQLL